MSRRVENGPARKHFKPSSAAGCMGAFTGSSKVEPGMLTAPAYAERGRAAKDSLRFDGNSRFRAPIEEPRQAW